MQRAFEQEFNSVEVAALFGRRRSETTPEEDALLAKYLVELWTAKLRLDFPSKSFCVQVVDATDDVEVRIVLYEQR
jgi:hypothetical protein